MTPCIVIMSLAHFFLNASSSQLSSWTLPVLTSALARVTDATFGGRRRATLHPCHDVQNLYPYPQPEQPGPGAFAAMSKRGADMSAKRQAYEVLPTR